MYFLLKTMKEAPIGWLVVNNQISHESVIVELSLSIKKKFMAMFDSKGVLLNMATEFSWRRTYRPTYLVEGVGSNK